MSLLTASRSASGGRPNSTEGGGARAAESGGKPVPRLYCTATGEVRGGGDVGGGEAWRAPDIAEGGVGTATATPPTAVAIQQASSSSNLMGLGRRRPKTFSAPLHQQPSPCQRPVPTPPAA